MPSPTTTSSQPQVATSSSRQPLPLLALHGFTGCGADFQWLAAETADLFNWHTYDFPGHGTNANHPATDDTGNNPSTRNRHDGSTPSSHKYSATPPHDDSSIPHHHDSPPPPHREPVAAQHDSSAIHHYSAAATARAIDARIRAIKATSGRRPILLGYSMGGRMALRTLAQYGIANVAGLILIGASAGLQSAAERRARRHSDHALATKIEAEGIDAFIEHWNKVPIIASQSRSPYFAQLQAMRRNNSAQGLANSLRGIGTGALAPVHQRLSQINIPCLLLTGKADTKFTTIARDLADALPTARYVTIPDAGHSPHWENPQATVQAIRNW